MSTQQCGRLQYCEKVGACQETYSSEFTSARRYSVSNNRARATPREGRESRRVVPRVDVGVDMRSVSTVLWGSPYSRLGSEVGCEWGSR